MGKLESVSTILEAFGIVTRSFNPMLLRDKKQKWERPEFENYKKVGHIKDTCWKLQWKPFDWKPKHRNDCDGEPMWLMLFRVDTN